MNLMIDFLAAAALYQVIIYKKKISYFSIGIFFLLLITASGLLELLPFFNSQPWRPYARYPSSFIQQVRQNTKPQAVFLVSQPRDLQLAGRKVFLGNYAGQDFRLRSDLRIMITHQIYTASNLQSFCSLVKKYQIDYVGTESFLTRQVIGHAKLLNIRDLNNRTSFIDVDRSCK